MSIPAKKYLIYPSNVSLKNSENKPPMKTYMRGANCYRKYQVNSALWECRLPSKISGKDYNKATQDAKLFSHLPCMNSKFLLTTVLRNLQWALRNLGYCPTTYIILLAMIALLSFPLFCSHRPSRSLITVTRNLFSSSSCMAPLSPDITQYYRTLVAITRSTECKWLILSMGLYFRDKQWGFLHDIHTLWIQFHIPYRNKTFVVSKCLRAALFPSFEEWPIENHSRCFLLCKNPSQNSFTAHWSVTQRHT